MSDPGLTSCEDCGSERYEDERCEPCHRAAIYDDCHQDRDE